MNRYIIAFSALLLSALAFANDDSARAQLVGTWQEENASGNAASVWVLESKGEALHIVHSQGDQKLSEFECTPTGAECEGRVSGKKAKVVMYFNGPTLVQMETVGSDITRRRFTVAAEPDMMELMVVPLVGDVKAETRHLKRTAGGH